MRAIVQDRYGSADVLALREIDTPAVGVDDVLVRVHAAGVDQGVWHIMAGLPYLVRIMGYGLRAPKVSVRGTDVAGRVEAVGANVTRFQPGDEVFGSCDGSFAEYACARADRLAPKPASLSFEQAAAVPVSGCTALLGIRDKGEVRAGQRVLVIGAGGGVGTFAVQIAKAFGAEVTGVCSTSKTDLVRSIGAERVIDYTREDPRRRTAALRRHPRHGGQPPAVAAPARPRPEGHARDHRSRGARTLARRRRSPTPRARALALRRPETAHVRLDGAQ